MSRRIRYLKPDFFSDEDIGELSYEIRLFYAGLWTQADKAGRLEDRPKRLKVEIMPYDNVDIEKMLQDLATPKKNSKRPFIRRYQVNDENYIQILAWDKHQKPHHTEIDSKIPPIPPLMGKEKGMGKEKQLGATAPLSNGSLTVNNPTNEAFEFFCKRFQETQKKDYIASFAKDKKILKDLLNKIPLEELKSSIDIYLTIPNKFCEEAGYTIGVFKSQVNRLRIEKKTQLVSEKTIKNILTGNAWLKRKEKEDVGQEGVS